MPTPEPDEVTITYLELLAPPARAPRPLPDGAAVVRARAPTAAFYRFLYREVGRRWGWTDRDRLSDDALEAAVGHADVYVRVLYRAGTPAGYAELDARRAGEVQVLYFGLMPHAIGAGLGTAFLDDTLEAAWALPGVGRVWVHTCTLDHPRALGVYRAAGFRPYRRATVVDGVTVDEETAADLEG